MRATLTLTVLALAAGACSSNEVELPTTAPDEVLTTLAPDGSSTTTTTTAGTDGMTTTTVGDGTTTTLSPGDGTTSTTSGTSTTEITSAPTTTLPVGPTTTIATQQTSPGCPQDLFVGRGSRPAKAETVLAAFDRGDGRTLWQLPLGLDYVVDTVATPTTVFAFLGSGLLIALDSATCEQRWRVGLGTPGGLAIADAVVVASDDRGIHAFSAGDGSVEWSTTLATGPRFAPVIVEDYVIVARSDRATVTVLTGSGTRLYDQTLSPFTGTIRGITADFGAWYATGNGRLAGRFNDNGSLLFDRSGTGIDPGPPSVADGSLYVSGLGPGGPVAAAFDFNTGDTLWQVPLTGTAPPPAVAPAVTSGRVHVLDAAGKLHHLDAATGATISVGTYPTGRTLAEFDDGLVLVESGGTVTAYDLAGAEVFGIRTGADGSVRITELDRAGQIVVTETYSVE